MITDTTTLTTHDQLVLALRALGFKVADTGAVRITDAQGKSCTVFVHRRASGAYVLSHPPTGGRAQTYRQTFKTFDRAVKQLRATRPL